MADRNRPAERDARVIYKSRTLSTESDEDDRDGKSVYRSRSRHDRYSGSRHGSNADFASAPRSSRSGQYRRDGRGSEEALIDVERSKQTRRSRSRPGRNSRESLTVDRDRERRSSPKSSAQYRDSRLEEHDSTRKSSKVLDYSVDGTVRRSGSAYVMDTRGDIEIIMPNRKQDGDQDFDGIYESEAPYYGSNYDGREYRPGKRGSVVVLRRDPTSPPRSGGRNKHDIRPPPLRNPRDIDDEDDDWGIINPMRDTRLDPGPNPRSRRPTQSSDDSYILVSPPQATRPSVRSAMQRKDYAESELGRRRSRSISFREKEARYHDEGEKRHERPGAEAELCGSYLKSRPDEEEASDIFSTYSAARTPSRSQGRDYAAAVYYDRSDNRQDDRHYHDRREMPYPPQKDYPPRRRSRSRSRRQQKEDSEDEQSHYSERVDKTYIKKTRYL